MKEKKTNSSSPPQKESPKNIIEHFLSGTRQLSLVEQQDNKKKIVILQNYDQKMLSFPESDIEKVLQRKNSCGEDFLQIDFKNGKKILLTHEFIGFSPAECSDMKAEQLPKVVTTADLLSVIEAMEGSLYGTDQYQESLNDIKLFFENDCQRSGIHWF